MLRSLAWASLGTGFIFLMTTLGAAVVFFFAGEIKLRLQAVMMGFAAGVMLAASVWSMIIPAVERTRAAGALPEWLPAVLGIAAGAVFLMLLDGFIARRGWGGAGRGFSHAAARDGDNRPQHTRGHGRRPRVRACGRRGGLRRGACPRAGDRHTELPEGAAVSLPLRQLGMPPGVRSG